MINSLNKEEDKIIIKAYRDKNPGAYYLYDVKKDKLIKIADIKPWINEEEMAEIKPIKYTSRDGLTIHGYLTIPKGVEVNKLPVVVFPHGGPWSRNIWEFRRDTQLLANRGYAVLQMNFRGSTGYGRRFKEAGFKEWGKAMQNDITDGVNWLIKKGIADKNRIAIYGISYGGYATLAGLVFTPDLYACGIDIAGPSNIFTLLESLPSYWEPVRRMFYEMMGDPQEDKELLREISPLFHVDKINKPLFVVQGAKDPRAPQSQAEQLVESLRCKGLEVKYMLKENEGHGYYNEENVLELYSEVEKFLEQHMK
jgi:dipeptidyl aminopeptidase/acylaminoacyl peptidase